MGHHPLALSAPGLGVYLTTCSHLSWPLLLAVGIQQLLVISQDGEYLWQLPRCAELGIGFVLGMD